MLRGFILLAEVGLFRGGAIGDMFQSWEAAGVFSYMLPFLIIFALIFGILSKVNLFGDKNKPISGVLALAVSLMAIQFGFVTVFFSDIFPRLGIALACVLVFLILLGLFGDANNRGLLNTLMWGSFGVAVIIVLQSTEMFGGGIQNILVMVPQWLFYVIVLVVLVAIVVMQKKEKPPIISNIVDGFGGGRK